MEYIARFLSNSTYCAATDSTLFSALESKIELYTSNGISERCPNQKNKLPGVIFADASSRRGYATFPFSEITLGLLLSPSKFIVIHRIQTSQCSSRNPSFPLTRSPKYFCRGIAVVKQAMANPSSMWISFDQRS